MKQLTIIISQDLEGEVQELISEANVDCYVKQPDAYGISHRCKSTIGDNMPWEATLLILGGEEKLLVELADKIKASMANKEYTPCLRMMLTPVDRLWY